MSRSCQSMQLLLRSTRLLPVPASELGSRSLVSTLLSPPSAAPAARYLPLATCLTSMAPASRSLTLGRPQAADGRRLPPSGPGTCSAGSASPVLHAELPVHHCPE